jgi:hypothetical protein
MNASVADLNAELAKEGLKLSSPNSSGAGWYVSVMVHGTVYKVWAVEVNP